MLSDSTPPKVDLFHCWVTEHFCSLFLALEDILMSWNLSMNRLFNQDKDGQKVSVLGEFVNIFHTFGDVYTDVDWLNTSVVCS